MMERFDVCIVGGGIAGASLAWALAGRRRVLLLERESQPGYHSTGRSAATLHRSYGNATVRTLTAASAAFYLDPPAGFAEVPLARPRGLVVVAGPDQLDALEAEVAVSRRFVPDIETLTPQACLARVPLLRRERIAAGMYDPSMQDLDVAAVLAGFVRGARARGAVLRTGAEVRDLVRTGDGWRIALPDGAAGCEVLVDAAGAWADGLAERAGVGGLGIVPKRRTAITVSVPAEARVNEWPMIHEVTEAWYVKPDAGRLLCSPADEIPSPACDAQPEELDVAICVDRIETAFDLAIRRVESRWAGLRCFARDKTPVLGFDPRAEGFFWLAGQGGYGIQTAPAMATLAAAQITGEAAPEGLAALADPLSPGRLLTPA